MSSVLVLFVALLVLSGPADEALRKATELLEAGDATAAEAEARRALSLSFRFVPEKEIGNRPDKGLLFEDMILEARRSYRARRARYFQVLGETLAAQERWRAARKALRRAHAIEPSAEILLAMAEHPDLDVGSRVDLLLDAYLAPGSDRARLEERLLESGAFRTRNALKASLDRKRFGELEARFGDLELEPSPFPVFQALTDAGNLTTSELLQAGTTLVVYVPTAACPHCSEELDGLVTPVLSAQRGGKLVEVVAFVSESDLEIARRIVRLLGMPVGVGQRRALPPNLSFYDSGEMRIVARGGMTQIRLPMSSEGTASEIQRRIEAVFDFLEAPELPTEDKPEEASVPLVTLERGASEQRTLFEWIEALEKLEVGPAPLEDLYGRLARQSLTVARGADRALGYEMLEALSGLEGAGAAKAQALGVLEPGIGERLLEEARNLDPSVRRTAPGEQGVFFVDPSRSEGTIGLVRSFQTGEGLRHLAFGLAERGTGLELRWALPVEERPEGVALVEEGTAIRFRQDREGEDECAGVKLVREGEIVYEGCPAKVLEGEVVDVAPALVDELDAGRFYYRRGVVGGGEPSALERGLSLFASGDFAAARSAFAEASDEVDPLAPYDASDLLYNEARALEEQGDRREALEIYRALGDVSYQEAVDERARAIEAGR